MFRKAVFLKIAFPGQPIWKFLANRFVEAQIHGKSQVKRNRLWKCVSPLRSSCGHRDSGLRESHSSNLSYNDSPSWKDSSIWRDSSSWRNISSYNE
jgi:hypothetical protein